MLGSVFPRSRLPPLVCRQECPAYPVGSLPLARQPLRLAHVLLPFSLCLGHHKSSLKQSCKNHKISERIIITRAIVSWTTTNPVKTQETTTSTKTKALTCTSLPGTTDLPKRLRSWKFNVRRKLPFNNDPEMKRCSDNTRHRKIQNGFQCLYFK